MSPRIPKYRKLDVVPDEKVKELKYVHLPWVNLIQEACINYISVKN